LICRFDECGASGDLFCIPPIAALHILAEGEEADEEDDLVNTHVVQLLRCNLFLPTFLILKHKVIAAKHAGTAVDDGELHDLVRRFLPAMDGLVKEVNMFVPQVVVEFNSGVVTGPSPKYF